MPAEEAEKIGRKKKKANPDTGFAGAFNVAAVMMFVLLTCCAVDYAQAQQRKYNRLIKDIKPNMEEYTASTQAWGDDFGAHSLAQGEIPQATRQGIDRMVADLQKQYVNRCGEWIISVMQQEFSDDI